MPKVKETKIEDWITEVYSVNNIYKEANSEPDKFLLLHGDVVCFDRKIIASKQTERVWMEGKNVLARHKLTKEEVRSSKKNSVVEAMVFGTPCVANNVERISEIIDDEE